MFLCLWKWTPYPLQTDTSVQVMYGTMTKERTLGGLFSFKHTLWAYYVVVSIFHKCKTDFVGCSSLTISCLFLSISTFLSLYATVCSCHGDANANFMTVSKIRSSLFSFYKAATESQIALSHSFTCSFAGVWCGRAHPLRLLHRVRDDFEIIICVANTFSHFIHCIPIEKDEISNVLLLDLTESTLIVHSSYWMYRTWKWNDFCKENFFYIWLIHTQCTVYTFTLLGWVR